MTEARPIVRFTGIDGFRYLLCFPVALLHSLPGEAGHTTAIWATALASVCRVAVPYFFIASGYFMRVPAQWTSAILLRPLVRLVPVYLAWFLIYAAIDALFYGRDSGMAAKELLTGGTAFHLWFLPVLAVTLAAVPTAIIMTGVRATTLGALGLAVLGLAFGAYHGVLHLHGVGGIRLTMAPALVLIGHRLARSEMRPAIGHAAGAVAIALLLVMMEEALIARLSGSTFTSHDIVAMTYPLGVATFLLSMSLNGVAWLNAPARLGVISLGVYAAHLIFVRLLMPWIGTGAPLRAFAVAAAAVLIATALSVALDRLPLTRRLVR